MDIKLKIYKWTIFGFQLMSPSDEDDMDFYYFTFHIMGCGFSFWRYGGISKLVFSAFMWSEFMVEPFMYEKELIADETEEEEL